MNYTIKQACAELDVSRSTLDRLVAAGDLVKVRSTTAPRRRAYITGTSLHAYKRRQAAEHQAAEHQTPKRKTAKAG